MPKYEVIMQCKTIVEVEAADGVEAEEEAYNNLYHEIYEGCLTAINFDVLEVIKEEPLGE